MPHLKKIRPKEYYNKTVFNTIEIEDFYSYRNFIKDFTNSWKIDFEKKYHTIPLYLIWAEKCSFLKKVIEKNYFNSTCFYWVDAGYFREKEEMDKYIDWPSINLYYSSLKLFLKHNLFIGKDQNVFTYIALSHPEIVKLVYCKSFFSLKGILS